MGNKKAKTVSSGIADLVVDALQEVKGQSIVCIDVTRLTEITDYMVIVTGTSSTHVKALADEVVKQVKEAGGRVNGIEGRMQAEWVLVDLGGVVVHIMLAPVRALYNLEDLWSFEADTEDSKATGAESRKDR
jgi:ribosome-associated protein